MGRRASVTPSIARCCPSMRKRPRAGSRSVLGRLCAISRSWLAWPRPTMSLLSREPRAVYRVCDEDEYLADISPADATDPTPADSRRLETPTDLRHLDRPSTGEPHGANRRRIGGLTLLGVVAGSVAILIATHTARPAPSVVPGGNPSADSRAATGHASRTLIPPSASRTLIPPSSASSASARTMRLRTASTRRAVAAVGSVALKMRTALERSPRRLESSAVVAPATRESSSSQPTSLASPGAEAELGFER